MGIVLCMYLKYAVWYTIVTLGLEHDLRSVCAAQLLESTQLSSLQTRSPLCQPFS